MISKKCEEKSLIIKKLKSSIISLIIFIVIILANMIVYPISLTNDETSGMEWFFFVLLPSIPAFIISFVLAVKSVLNFIKDKKKRLETSQCMDIFIILNLFQLVLMIIIVVCIGYYL